MSDREEKIEELKEILLSQPDAEGHESFLLRNLEMLYDCSQEEFDEAYNGVMEAYNELGN